MGMLEGLRDYLEMIQVIDHDHSKDGKPAKLVNGEFPVINVFYCSSQSAWLLFMSRKARKERRISNYFLCALCELCATLF
jgi:hypothetical protein